MFDPGIIDGVEGWLNLVEAEYLYNRVRECGGIVVELGCWKGRSTLSMLMGAKDAGKVCSVHSFDHFCGSPEHGKVQVFPEFCKNIQRIPGIQPHIHKVDLDEFCFHEGAEIPQPISLLFIDSGHDYNSVARDFLCFSPKVVPGGLIIFHDYDVRWPNVRSFVNRCPMYFPVQFVESPRNTTFAVVRKI